MKPDRVFETLWYKKPTKMDSLVMFRFYYVHSSIIKVKQLCREVDMLQLFLLLLDRVIRSLMLIYWKSSSFIANHHVMLTYCWDTAYNVFNGECYNFMCNCVYCFYVIVFMPSTCHFVSNSLINGQAVPKHVAGKRKIFVNYVINN